jgi:hypothetical protein
MHRSYPTKFFAMFILLRLLGVYAIAQQEKDAVGLERSKEQNQYSRKLLSSRSLATVDVYSTVEITSSNQCETTDEGLGTRQTLTENECRAHALRSGEEFASAGSQSTAWPRGCYKKKSDNQWYFNSYSSSSTVGSNCGDSNVTACACRFVSYQEFISGSACHQRGAGYVNLKDATECKNYGVLSGVKQVGYSRGSYGFSSSSSSTNSGCHVKNSGGTNSLFFQPNENTGDSCSSHNAGMCICKMTTPYNYVLRTAGRCTDNGALITSAWHCQVAAKMMGLTSFGQTSTSSEQLTNPSGCHSVPRGFKQVLH